MDELAKDSDEKLPLVMPDRTDQPSEQRSGYDVTPSTMKEHEEDEEDLDEVDDANLMALERSFREVLREISNDEGLDKFLAEYEKLYRALKRAHDSERRLLQKCRQLNSEITANSSKVQAALKLSQDDQIVIANLKKELEVAWSRLDQASEKEKHARATTQSLRNELTSLQMTLEEGKEISGTQHSNLLDMTRIKHELESERDERLREIASLRTKLHEIKESGNCMDDQTRQAIEIIAQLKADVQAKTNEVQRDTARREKLERELEYSKESIGNKEADIKNLHSVINKFQGQMSDMEGTVREYRLAMVRQRKETDELQSKMIQMQRNIDEHDSSFELLQHEIRDKKIDLKSREVELKKARAEIDKLHKIRVILLRDVQTAKDQTREVETKIQAMTADINVVTNEINMAKRKAVEDKMKIEELEGEKEALQKALTRTNESAAICDEMLRLQEAKLSKMSSEIRQLKEEAVKQRTIIFALEKTRDQHIRDATKCTKQIMQMTEVSKTMELELFDYKKRMLEAEAKLKQTQGLFEAVRSDRNLYGKNLLEARDEIAEQKQKLKLAQHQVDQIKEEISLKEAQIIKDHMENAHIEKEKEILQAEVQRLKAQSAEAKLVFDALDFEQRKLKKNVSAYEADVDKFKKKLKEVVTERDILGAQLVRRNDELSLLYEKIKLQTQLMSKGEKQYEQRLEDIRVLKLEVRSLRCKKTILQRHVEVVDDLRREFNMAQKDLIEARLRIRALEDELINPTNIHRWRALEGRDPSLYEMVLKLQTVQKRLISKTEEVVEKELLLKEKERIYLEMKKQLMRHPGPDVVERLAAAREVLKAKGRQMKAITSELNLYVTQSSDYKREIDRLRRELQDARTKYYDCKRRNFQRSQVRMHSLMDTEIRPQQPADRPVYLGGGFLVVSSIDAAADNNKRSSNDANNCI